MDIFCDTNVLIAAIEAAHSHHHRARPILTTIISGTHRGFASLHSIAEMYGALTRMPVQPRIHPQDAKRLIEANISPHFHFIEATQKQYEDAIALVANLGLPGAKVYDALILTCAEKSGAERIYTFNTADFSALASPELRRKLVEP